MIRVSAATIALAASAWPALAHHSRANFDLADTVEIEGTVTEFTWRNPHAFAVVETARFSRVKWGNGRGVDSGARAMCCRNTSAIRPRRAGI